MRITPNDSDIDMMISKFIINLPETELRDDRIWIHLQKMFHYFIDEVVDLQPLADFQMHDKQLKEFFTIAVEKLPSFLKLDPYKITKMINDGYSATPVYGVIILNLEQTKILLVQSHKPAGMYGIPKGKINEEETPIQCACRQVKEQVGINVQISQNNKIQVSYSKSCIFYICKIDQNNINTFVVKNTAHEKSKGKKKTSKQIKSLAWFSLSNGEQLRLNIATKKAIQKLRSQRGVGTFSNIRNEQTSHSKPKTLNKSSNGYSQNQQGSQSAKLKYRQVTPQVGQTNSPNRLNSLPSQCPFDLYRIKNRKVYEQLFLNDNI